MKTVTQYQLLFLAKQELTRRFDEVNGKSDKRSKAYLKMYMEQLAEIQEVMDNITKENEMENKK